MSLSHDICRCLGLLPGLTVEQRCSKRSSCQRYTERATGGERTPHAQWLCPGADEFFEAYLPTDERKPSA